MKKTITLMLLVFAAVIAWAQSPPVTPTHQCDIVITGDFDSECIYDYKDEITDEYPNLMVACKGSTVTYTAYANMGTVTPTGYIWEIYGDVTHTVSGNSVTVEWGNDEWAYVVATAYDAGGDTCTGSSRVKLIDTPVVGATTVPNYTVMSTGDKVIRVCEGGTVEFVDNSTAGSSDIAGYFWSTGSIQSSTPNFTLENVIYGASITHRVYNNCGCYDEEVYYIEVVSGADLEIDCYGTVCKDAMVTYKAIRPLCTDYQWYVYGGTIIRGQGTATPTVMWDNPTDGYGVIGLDGYQCGETVCPRLMSRKVPVIHGDIDINGSTDVCLGDAVLYSLPLFGSTEYLWEVTPLTGVDTSMKTHSNETRFVFNQEGTYTLRCSYRCDFLDCGPYNAKELTIIVKPDLTIIGEDRICISNACSLQVMPVVSATWTAYDLANSNAVVATGSGSAFSHTFSHKGRYLITAAHPDYCTEATFVLEVKDTPPAPTVTDLDPHNRHTACLNGGIALDGTPSDPNYNLVWHPACTTATPQYYNGDSVTIMYQNEVCDVYVYNYDRVLQCQSSNYYIHQVSEFVPLPLNIDDTVTVCPGTIIVWGDDKVPDQSGEGMLYEWSIQDNKQYCASVQGSHFMNSVTLAVNVISTPTTFYVKLRRTYCGIHLDSYIYIIVNNGSQTPATITGPNEVCVHEDATYTGSGNDSNTYRWFIEGSQYTGTSATHTFHHEGVRSVVLYSSSYDYCTDTSYMAKATKNVVVNPLPMVQKLEYNSTTHMICVVPPLSTTDYTFEWYHQTTYGSGPSPIYGETGNSIPAETGPNAGGTYSCVVTSIATGCSKTVSMYYTPYNELGPECSGLPITGTYNYCTHTLTVSTRNDLNNIQWTVTGGPKEIVEQYAPHNYMADIRLDDIGIYTINASTSWNMDCYSGEYTQTVDFIPDFTFIPECDRIRIVNNSRYIGSGQTVVYINVTSPCGNQTELIQMPVSASSYTYIPTHPYPNSLCLYTFQLVGYGSNGNITPGCQLGTAFIGDPPTQFGLGDVSIHSANIYEHKTCNNTPIRLRAQVGMFGPVRSTEWNFGDGSSFHTDGNHIDHTFASPLLYTVTVAATNNLGCVKNASFEITSSNNTLNGGDLNNIGNIVCPYSTPKDILFDLHFSDNQYTWWRLKDQTHVSGANPYSVYQPDDYFVYVINENYCQREATTFVQFLNAPTASIYADNFNCCAGDSITLYGEQGPPDNTLSYSWTITGPGSFSQTSTEPNFTFTAPDATGNYSVSLTVSNTNCSSTATDTITVNAKPAAPTLTFSGSPCISDAPVTIAATGFTGEMHWSNGGTGATADYYTHGLATAYYYNPAIGCASDTATIRIHKQPDFDALLTGCYEKCWDFFDYYLPVWGLTDDSQDVSWEWNLNGTPIATGSGNYTYSPLRVPLRGLGRYNMHIDYSGGSCSEVSPNLTISDKKLCDCDSISVSYTLDTILNNCRLSYSARVEICNNRRFRKFCPGQLEPILIDTNIKNVSHTFVPSTIGAGDCYTFDITFDVVTLAPSSATFKITDNNCYECEMMFSIDIMPTTDCISSMSLDVIKVDETLTSSAAGYFYFDCDVSPAESVLTFWTEPPMVIDYLFDGIDNVTGLGMIDPDLLSQLIYDGADVCFYAITCFKDTICKRYVCIPAEDLEDLITENRSDPGSGGKGKHGAIDGMDAENPTVSLIPNPTSGVVEVDGVQSEVMEIVVMDMTGKHQATFLNTSKFDVSTLAAGSYIVRINTKDGAGQAYVTYHKLIKK